MQINSVELETPYGRLLIPMDSSNTLPENLTEAKAKALLQIHRLLLRSHDPHTNQIHLVAAGWRENGKN